MKTYRVCVYEYEGDKSARDLAMGDFQLRDIVEIVRTDAELQSAFSLMLAELDRQSPLNDEVVTA